MKDQAQTRIGLPPQETLRGYRIWDSYFTPAHGHPGRDGSSRILAEMDRSRRAVELACIEKLCFFPHVGIGTTSDPALEALLREKPETVSRPFEKWPDQLIGMIQLNSKDVSASLAAIDRWIRDGEMRGAYFPGGGPGALPCSHKNCIPLVERLIELEAVIMQHTWVVTGGKTSPGHSTPAELAELAAKYPDHVFVCAHAGGEWEKGIRAVSGLDNIVIETSGFDATAGFLEMAVRELGERRIIWGSHLPARSLGTELSKVLGAEIQESAKKKILGENLRELLNQQEGTEATETNAGKHA